MNWLVLSYYLIAGMNLNQSLTIQSPDGYAAWQAPQNAAVTTLGAELLAMDHLFLSAETKTEETHIGDIHFSPFLTEYNVKAGLRFEGFEAGFVDDCTHSIFGSDMAILHGGWYGFYVSFKGSTKLF